MVVIILGVGVIMYYHLDYVLNLIVIVILILY